MKAVRVCPPMKIEHLRLVDIPKPAPGVGQVRVRLRAVALNHRELLIMEGTWPDWGEFTLGSDGAGVIDALGEGVGEVCVGDEVIINPGLGWGSDMRTPASTFNTLGGPSDGTFAEAVVVPACNVYTRPNYLTWQEAAALPVASLSAYRALVVRARLAAGEVLLIHGIGGGLAQAGLMIAKALNATVIVTSGSDTKLARAREMGADYTINYRLEDWRYEVAKLTREVGPDVVLDCVGGETLAGSVEGVRIGGRIVSLGVTTGAITQLPVRSLFVRHVDLLGTSLGSRMDFAGTLHLYAQNVLRPVIDRVLSLSEVSKAFSILARGEHFGKIVLRVADI
jgi:zinc-binding alcohol dehydrogenase/oxidoreductase